MYVMIEDSATPVPNPSEDPVAQTSVFTTLQADMIAPILQTPRVTSVTSSGATLTVNANESGTVYFKVQPSSKSAPNVTTVKSEATNTGGTAYTRGDQDLEISLPSAATEYIVYVMIEDSATPVPNPSEDPVAQTSVFTTLQADMIAPILQTPRVTRVTSSGATLTVNADVAGTVYFKVQPSSETAPNVTTVKSEATNTGGTAYTRGDQDLEISLPSAATEYIVYVMIEDSATPVPNPLEDPVAQTSVFTTLQADMIAPILQTPRVTSVTSSGATLTVNANEAGTVYFKVQPSSEAAPNVTTVKSEATNTGGTAYTRGDQDLEISLPSAATEYIVYVMIEDSATPVPNPSEDPVAQTSVFTTLQADMIAPILQTPRVTSVTSSGATLTVNANEAGTVYFKVQPSSEAAPNVTTVKSEATNTGGTAYTRGDQDLEISLPSAATEYIVYVMVEDSATPVPNPSEDPVAQTSVFTTLQADMIAPILQTPRVTSVTSSGATLTVNANESGTVYFKVQPSSESAPNVTTVKSEATNTGGTAYTRGDQDLEISLPSAATEYIVYVMIEDSATPVPNPSEDPVAQTSVFTTLQADVIAPILQTQRVTSVTSSGATLTVNANEAGTVYSKVQPSSEAAPNLTTVKSEATNTGGTAYTRGDQDLEISLPSAATEYTVYVMVEDSATPLPNPSEVPVAQTSVFTTLQADMIAPILQTSRVTSVTSSGATLTVNASEAGTVYFKVQPSSEAAPNVTTVKSEATNTGGTAYTGGDQDLEISLPSAATEYIVYVMVEDSATPVPNPSEDPVAQTPVFTTLQADMIAPILQTPRVTSVTSSGATLMVNANEAGTVYFKAQPSSEATPNVTTVKSEATNTGGTAYTGGDQDLEISLPSAATEYIVYVMVEDSATPVPNPSEDPVAQTSVFTTLQADIIAPILQTPRVTSVTSSGATLTVNANEAGTVYFKVQPSSEAAPNVTTVKSEATNTGGTAYTRGDQDLEISLPSAATEYIVYVMVEDSATPVPNPSEDPVAQTSVFTTLQADIIASILQTPRVTSVTSSGATLTVNANEAGTVYFKVQPSSEAAPNVTTVKSEATNTGGTAYTRGDQDLEISLPSAATEYIVYVMVEDNATPVPNPSEDPVAQTSVFTTLQASDDTSQVARILVALVTLFVSYLYYLRRAAVAMAETEAVPADVVTFVPPTTTENQLPIPSATRFQPLLAATISTPAEDTAAVAEAERVAADAEALQALRAAARIREEQRREGPSNFTVVTPPMRQVAEAAKSVRTAANLLVVMQSSGCSPDLSDIRCLEAAIDAFGRERFWSNLLPFICNEASRLAEAYTANPVPILGTSAQLSIRISRRDCIGILANSLLCAWPDRPTLDVACAAPARDLPSINMDQLVSVTWAKKSSFGNTESAQGAKLESLLCYFQRQHDRIQAGTLPTDNVTFVLNSPPPLHWQSTHAPLSRLDVLPLHRSIGADSGSELFHADFANKCFGGGVLKNGCVQEEILLATHPEMIVGRLFLPVMTDVQAILVHGAETFAKTSGYKKTLKFEGGADEPVPRKFPWHAAFDAVDYSKQSPDVQARPESVRRELNKAWAAFKAPPGFTTPRVIATGNWGAGVFKGDAQLKALIQWVAASCAGD